jgi:hypothetical protein
VTYVIVRADSSAPHPAGTPGPGGVRIAAEFEDAKVLAITADRALIYIAASTGFYPREHDGPRSWQWMGAAAAWTIVNASEEAVSASLDLELSAFHHPRRLELLLDGHLLRMLAVVPERRTYRIGPFTVSPGHHAVGFRASEAPTVAADVVHNGDPRALSFALGTWTWLLDEGAP